MGIKLLMSWLHNKLGCYRCIHVVSRWPSLDAVFWSLSNSKFLVTFVASQTCTYSCTVYMLLQNNVVAGYINSTV